MAIGTPVNRFAARTSWPSLNTTLNLTPSSDIPVGSTAILLSHMITGASTSTVSAVTDTVGNTWTVDVAYYNGANESIAIAHCHVTTAITAASDHLTVTRTGGVPATNYDAVIYSVTGLATSSETDQTATGTGSGTSYSVGPTGTLAQADEIAFACWGNGVTATPTQSNIGTWTGLTGASTLTAIYKIVAAATALTAAETSNSSTWIGALATFKGVTAAPSSAASFGTGLVALFSHFRW